jgi:hypothetical protein
VHRRRRDLTATVRTLHDQGTTQHTRFIATALAEGDREVAERVAKHALPEPGTRRAARSRATTQSTPCWRRPLHHAGARTITDVLDSVLNECCLPLFLMMYLMSSPPSTSAARSLI